jgi:hypothetical protein
LPLQLYQQNLFTQQSRDPGIYTETYNLTADIIAPTIQEIQALAEEEEVDQELEDAIADVVLISRGSRRRKATQKAVESTAQSSKRRRLH